MGHTVLAVPVPALDDWVRARTAVYDASFVSTDPGFVHAHITVLAPWIRDPGDADLAAVAMIASQVPPFEVELDVVDVFPDGTIHLVPDPADQLSRLTELVAGAFPAHPPYGGRYPRVEPHLTLDRATVTITTDSIRAELAPVLPVRFTVQRLDLQWWANHDCRLMQSWDLG